MKAALTAVIRMTVFATKDNTMTKIKIKGRMIAMSDSGNAVGSIAPCHHQHMSRGATSTHAMKTCGTDVCPVIMASSAFVAMPLSSMSSSTTVYMACQTPGKRTGLSVLQCGGLRTLAFERPA